MAARLLLHENGVDDLRLKMSGARRHTSKKSQQATSPSFTLWICLKNPYPGTFWISWWNRKMMEHQWNRPRSSRVFELWMQLGK